MVRAVALSVVVPAYNEVKSIRLLVEQCVAALEPLDIGPWEIVLVDDGSGDGTPDVMRELARERTGVRAVLLRAHVGKAAALMAGFHEALGGLIITMDADLQDDPAEIPRFIAAIEGGLDLVSGWKKERHDPVQRRVFSRVFNYVLRKTSGVTLHDANCGFKAYRRWCIVDLEIRGNQHRFIPAILEQRGARIGEIEVRHRARPFGASKYGPARYAQGPIDLATMLLLTRFAQKPLYFFALVGLPLLALGALIGGVLVASHVLHLIDPAIGMELTIRPLLIIAAVLLLAGLQIFLIGLIAELVQQSSRIEKSYDIREIVFSAEQGGDVPPIAASREGRLPAERAVFGDPARSKAG
jgi:glycosyltransferase involved in cell wall biosynthesis